MVTYVGWSAWKWSPGNTTKPCLAWLEIKKGLIPKLQASWSQGQGWAMSIAIVRATNHACIRGSRPTSRPQPLSYYKADKRISELNKNFHAKTNRIKFLSWCLPQAHGFQTQVVNFEYFYSYHSCSYSSCRTVELNHRQRQDGSNSKGNATSALCVSQ